MKPSQTLMSAFLFLLVSCVFMFPAQVQAAAPLDPALIPQWVNQITGPPPVYVPINVTDSFGNVIRQEYTVNVTQFTQQMLPTQDATGKPTGFGATTVFGYGGLAMDPVTGRYLGYVRSTPGPSFEAIRNVPIQVKWVNNLVDAEGKPLGSMFAVDPTIHWANPSGMDMPA